MPDFTAQLAQIQKEIDQEKRELALSRKNSVDLSQRSVSADSNQENQSSVPSELISELSALCESHKKVSKLINDKRVDQSVEELAVFVSQVAYFNNNYPETLLGVDLRRKIDAITSGIDSLAEEEWKDAVEISDSCILFHTPRDLSKRAVETNKDAFMASLDRQIIQPLLDLKIDLSLAESRLEWTPRTVLPTVAELATNVRTLGNFISQAPAPLETLIPKRFGVQFVRKLLHQTLAKLYPNESNPSDFQNQLEKTLPALEAEVLAPLWTRSSEISRYVEDFPSLWPKVRQEHYLMQLRDIYSGPITPESRLDIVDWFEESEPAPAVAQDDWDWDDDEEEEGDTLKTETNSLPIPGSVGRLISLWRSYGQECKPMSLFYTMYRALVPIAYQANDLWIYEDTCKFLSHIKASPATQNSQIEADCEPLVQLCDTHLDQFVKTKLDVFENELLPALFLHDHHQKDAVAKILGAVDELAVTVNSVGGPVLRERITGLIVERVAVYVISAVESLPDIGDSESQQLAITITRLNPLGVYFAQVADAVPSWTKMETLKDFLTGSLHSIGELLDQHRLLDFTPDEAAKLLSALFQESNDRNRLMARFYRTLS